METQLLKNPEIFPSTEVLKNILGDVYGVLKTLQTQLEQDALTFNWHYYNDGKAWLCKVCHKKKTIFWLSVWEGFFKISFFFLERHLEGIAALEINKSVFAIQKGVGKMIPVIFNVTGMVQIPDLLKMVEFKSKTK